MTTTTIGTSVPAAFQKRYNELVEEIRIRELNSIEKEELDWLENHIGIEGYNPIEDNIPLNTDSYKPSHYLQCPPGTSGFYSYVESRGGKYTVTQFYGLQGFLKKYFSKRITMRMVNEAEAFLKAHGEPFNREGWEYIVNVHKGKLPLRIKAVPEGMLIPTHNVLMTIENTDPNCYWLVSYVETMILRAIWYGTTVATQSWHIKQIIKQFLTETGDPSLINFKLHDFGARGVSSQESAAIGGSAHLLNFMGSDTIAAALYLQQFYNANGMPSFSIPAAEHSTITSWGKEHEVDAYRNMLTQFGKPGALLAVVSDSYDIYNACRIWGTQLKDAVIASEAIVVIRPDSGYPAAVVLKCAEILDEYFGSTINTKGYKVLNNVRIIQGDGINEQSIREILGELKSHGFSADNVAFGMGGALLQQVNRDTQKFAMKASAAKIDGQWIDVFKDPITDLGKRSKKGRLELVRNGKGEISTVSEHQAVGHEKLLELVWLNGDLIRDMNLDTLRDNGNKGI